MEKEEENQTFYINEIRVNPQHNEIQRQDQCVRIQPKVMAVLCYLSTHSDRVISNEELIENVWQGRVVTHGSVQKSINALRSALAELDASTEYVTHFSKRGYQLVQQVKQADVPPTSPVKPSSVLNRWLVSGVSLLLVVSIAAYSFFNLKIEPNLAVDNTPREEAFENNSSNGEPENLWEGVARTTNQRSALSKPVVFKEAASDIEFTVGSRLPAPHPKGRGLAFVQVLGEGQGAENKVMIQNVNGPAWTLADSHADWVALEWSASGRNLVALERWSAEDEFRSSYFYKKPIHFYTFHIFTLDFKGEKLIEKNRLSQWHGRVASVTWWDENTLEFVASQGTQTSFDRYRYQIPDQNLSLLPRSPDEAEPLASSVYNKQTALLIRKSDDVWLEFLSEDGQVRHSQLIKKLPSALSWSPDGEGVIVFNSNANDHNFYTENGSERSFSFDISDAEHINHLAFSHQAQVFWLELVNSENPVLLFESNSNSHAEAVALAHYDGGVITPEGKSLVALFKNGREQHLEFITSSSRRKIHLQQNIRELQAIFSSVEEEQLHIIADASLWTLNFKNETLLKVSELNLDFDPIIYLPDSKSLWGVKNQNGIRNIIVAKLNEGQSRPVTFGSIGSVLPASDLLYFQYTDQPGLWAVDYQNQEISKIENTMPANVKLLALEDEQIYYLKGQLCHESDVFVYSLLNTKHTRFKSYVNHALDTLEYHPSGLSVARKCSISTSKIKMFAR